MFISQTLGLMLTIFCVLASSCLSVRATWAAGEPPLIQYQGGRSVSAKSCDSLLTKRHKVFSFFRREKIEFSSAQDLLTKLTARPEKKRVALLKRALSKVESLSDGDAAVLLRAFDQPKAIEQAFKVLKKKLVVDQNSIALANRVALLKDIPSYAKALLVGETTLYIESNELRPYFETKSKDLADLVEVLSAFKSVRLVNLMPIDLLDRMMKLPHGDFLAEEAALKLVTLVSYGHQPELIEVLATLHTATAFYVQRYESRDARAALKLYARHLDMQARWNLRTNSKAARDSELVWIASHLSDPNTQIESMKRLNDYVKKKRVITKFDLEIILNAIPAGVNSGEKEALAQVYRAVKKAKLGSYSISSEQWGPYSIAVAFSAVSKLDSIGSEFEQNMLLEKVNQVLENSYNWRRYSSEHQADLKHVFFLKLNSKLK